MGNTIKIPMPLEPNGPDFKVVDAEHISYSREYTDAGGILAQLTNTKDALDVLYTTVMAEPQMYYFTDDLSGDTPVQKNFYTQSTTITLGSELVLPICINTPSIGNCVATVYVKTSTADDSKYTFFKTVTLAKGMNQVLRLGKFSAMADNTYRVYVTDGLGKTAYTPWLQQDGEYKIDYLEYRRLCSDVTFTANTTTADLIKVYSLAEDLLEYNFSARTALSGYGYLLYQLKAPGQQLATQSVTSDTLQDWNILPIILGEGETEATQLPGGKSIQHCCSITLPDGGTDAGQYTLYTALLITESRLNIANPQVPEDSLIASAVLSRAVDRLVANSIAVTVVSPIENQISSADYLSLEAIGKTNIQALCVTNGLYLTGNIYYSTTQAPDYYYCPECRKVHTFAAVNNNSGKCPSGHSDKLIGLRSFSGKLYEQATTTGLVAPRWTIARLAFPAELIDTSSVSCLLELKVSTPYSPDLGGDTLHTFNYLQFFNLEKAESMTSIVEDGLVFNLDTINMVGLTTTDTTVESITPVNIAGQNSILGLKFFKTAAGSTGLIDDVEDAQCLKFTRESYGLMYRRDIGSEILKPYSPFSQLLRVNTSGEAGNRQFTMEAYVKGIEIGNLAAKVLSMRNEAESYTAAGVGMSIAPNKVLTYLNGIDTNVTTLSDTWQHVVMTIDESIADSESDILDLRPYPTVRIYIDGTLVAAKRYTKTSNNIYGADIGKLPPVTLNGSVEVGTAADFTASNITLDNINVPENTTGECKIKVLRFYNTALTAEQVYNNYLNTRTADELEVVNARNSNGLNKIYFVANPLIDKATLMTKELSTLTDEEKKDLAKWESYDHKDPLKVKLPTTFSHLHQIKDKYTIQNEQGTVIHGSKTALVNCTMYASKLNDLGEVEWLRYPDVDVYLQGTSSLAYPVKNFQIKVYEFEETEKDGVSCYRRISRKILPPHQSEETGWYTTSSVYTLKCDFMEHSHRNNTPTAGYYQDRVLDAVIKEVQKCTTDEIANYYSPARSITRAAENGAPIHPYRDAIDGFACAVYYTEINNGGSWEDNRYVPTDSEQYTGTYMFNVDKEGAQLGFKVDTEELAACNNMPAEDKALLANSDAETVACISYEGAANNDNAAAAFITFDTAYSTNFKQFYDALVAFAKDGTALKDDDDSDFSLEDLVGESCYKIEGGKLIDIDTEEEVTLAKFSSDIVAGKFALRLSEEKANGTRWSSTLTVYDYFKATLEPRFSYEEDDKEAMYAPIRRAIQWVASATNNETKFRNEFKNYFSFEYCLAYYLQLQVFTQVDNAGKNAMFDVWGTSDLLTTPDGLSITSKLGKLYPRPYDMDTQMGLDNSGSDCIPVIAELNSVLSPNTCKGSTINGSESQFIPAWDTISASDHARYKTYNTSNSNLWKAFGRYFSQEIKDTYIALRKSGIYNVDAICNYINSKTYDVIGEKFYNQDASLKYFNFKMTAAEIDADKNGTSVGESTEDNTTKIFYEKYLMCISGNRKARYKAFLTQRIAFLDSLFGYNAESDYVDLRFGYAANDPLIKTIGSTNFVPLGISVHTPQYIKFTVGTNDAHYTALVTPEDTYTLDGQTYEGVLFYLPATSTASDRECFISPASEIKTFTHLSHLVPKKCQLDAARKLVELDVSDCKALHEFSLNSAKFLQTLKLDNTTALTTAIDLRESSNLHAISAISSGITKLDFPEKSSLNSLNLTNSNISELNLTNNALITNELSSLNLTGCRNLRSIRIENCANIVLNKTKTFQSTLTDPSKLTTLRLKNCDQIEYLDFTNCHEFSTLELVLKNLTELKLNNSRASVFKYANNAGGLDLSQLPALAVLDLSQAGGNENIQTSFGVVLLPTDTNTLQTLKLSASTLGAIYTPGAVPEWGTYNFNGLTNLRDMQFSNNVALQKVSNLKLAVNRSSLFYNCENLAKFINCELTVQNPNHFSSMFSHCRNLTSIVPTGTEGIRFKTPEDITSILNAGGADASSMFYNCSKIDMSSLKYAVHCLLAAGVTKFNSFALQAMQSNADYSSTGVVLESDFFKATDTSLTSWESDVARRGQYLSKIAQTLPKVTTIASCFYNTPISSVGQNLLNDLTGLTTVTQMFYNCTKLAYVPKDLFMQNTQLTSCRRTFAHCSNLGNTSTANCILTPKEAEQTAYTSAIFNEAALVTDITGMFYGCANINPTDGFVGFFKPLSALSTAGLAFARCSKLSTLGPDIFNSSELTNIDGVFAYSFITENLNLEIPTSLFGTETKYNLISARGLFAGCTALTGSLNKDFFAKTPKLKDIGAGYVAGYSNDESASVMVSGMFGNTALKSIATKLFDPLTDLISCSGFLCKTTSPTSSSTSSIATTNSSFEGFIDESDKIQTTIPYDFFVKNTALTNTSYMFAGNTAISGITTDTEQTTPTFLPTGIVNISGMFSTTGLATGIPENIFRNKAKLENISYVFARCSSLDFDLASKPFEGCSSLKNCRGAFMNSGLTGSQAKLDPEDLSVIPANLFNSCRDSLEDVSYMFANCTQLEGYLGTGYAIVNDPDIMVDRYRSQLENKSSIQLTAMNTALATKVSGIKTNPKEDSEISNSCTDFTNAIINLKNSTEEEFESGCETAKAILETNIQNRLVNYWTAQVENVINETALWKAEEIDSVLISKLTTGKSERVILTVTVPQQVGSSRLNVAKTFNIQVDFTAPEFAAADANAKQEVFDRLKLKDNESYVYYLSQSSNKYVDVQQEGLLGGCKALKSVAGLFLKCKNLTGSIPADLFTGKTKTEMPISSIEAIFAGCSRLSTSLSLGQPSTVKLRKATGTGDDRYFRLRIPNAGNFNEVYPHIVIEHAAYKAGDLVDNYGYAPCLDATDANYYKYNLYQSDSAEPYTDIRNNSAHQEAACTYLAPADWLAYVGSGSNKLTKASHAFSLIGTFDLLDFYNLDKSQRNNTTKYWQGFYKDGLAKFAENTSAFDPEGENLSPEGYPLRLSIPKEFFANKPLIDTNYAFFANASISGTRLTNEFMANSASSSIPNRIQSMQGMFALSNVISSAYGSAFCNTTPKAIALSDVSYLFACTNTIDFGSSIDEFKTLWQTEPIAALGSGLQNNVSMTDFNDFNKVSIRTKAFAGQSIAPYNSGGAQYSEYTNTANWAWYTLFSSYVTKFNALVTTELASMKR